ncbi:MAG: ferrous iron transport protein B [Bacteroidetes bacterium]|nr:ferrous iron transport protein B [Bacteroidota bacterium]
MSKRLNVALIGNPNTGKSSVFNDLTGLNQKVGNYPGITVEKKEGICKLERGLKAHILDLPGTYSLNASSLDESLVIELLLNKNDKDYPDVAVVISDVENLKRNLLLFTQIKDLKIPVILVINMSDVMKRKGITINISNLEKFLQTKVVLYSSRKKEGLFELKKIISKYKELSVNSLINIKDIDRNYFEGLEKTFPNQLIYKLWLVITQDVNFGNLDRDKVKDSSNFQTKPISYLKSLQQKETIKRYQFINNVLKQSYILDPKSATGFESKLDSILIHKFWGYAIFFLILLTIFQAIFDWSSYPMDAIDSAFSQLSSFSKAQLPPGTFTSLLSEGIIPGIGGIVIFIPQIAFLFMFISVLEETGYMSRVVFLMDRVMRRYGLSGKSIVPLISGTACAIPAIMATRNIENWKERLITILVTPFTTCSARLPVYLILISLVIPNERFLGINAQGLTLMGLYLLGFLAAIFSAYILNKILKIKSKTFFVIEMPNYKLPLFRNVLFTVIEKTKSFVFEAGKIILSISVLLWVLASNGIGEKFNTAETAINYTDYENPSDYNNKLSAYKLEHSILGNIGKSIEPIISPLGYDWKIGIAIVTSFAAREVFVGTLATIYSVESDKEESIRERMSNEIREDGTPLFGLASGVSLMIFYAFAMQCMSTLAVVKKETNSWKWPAAQLIIMTVIAYLAALIVYQLIS